MISIRQLSFRYQGAALPAVRDMHLDLRDGEILAVLGANGSGKSTLARLMGGLLLPQQGAVLVDGVATLQPPAGWFMHQHVGMVFQNPEHQIVSTVVENEVAFGLENLLHSSQDMERRVVECLEMVGLGHLRRANPHELSAGEQQRLAIAGALAAEPGHLLLDEATSLLDDQTRAALMQTVTHLARRLHLSVALITHRMDEVLFADRVLVLAHGDLVFADSPAALFAQADRLARWNLSLPPLQALIAQFREAGVALPAHIASVPDLVESLWP